MTPEQIKALVERSGVKLPENKYESTGDIKDINTHTVNQLHAVLAIVCNTITALRERLGEAG